MDAFENDWDDQLGPELEHPYMQELCGWLRQRAPFYPPLPLVFNAFRHTSIADTRVVILGQDPYHGPGQAMGLSFSVPPGVDIPPSLRNIFKEVCSDLSCGGTPPNGDLTPWAEQGVLLLNSVLTVSPGKPASHAGHGWERFTDKAIQILSEQRQDLVFMLWGAYAQRKAEMIDPEKHLLIKSSHPSPLSASRGFLGSRPFTRANAWLVENGEATIDWNHWKAG